MQTLLSSSYLSYGVESLDKDTEEIHLLAKYLRSNFDSKVDRLASRRDKLLDTIASSARVCRAWYSWAIPLAARIQCDMPEHTAVARKRRRFSAISYKLA